MLSPSAARQDLRSLLSEIDTMPLNRRHWLIFGVCAAGFFFDSMDLQIMSLIAPVVLRQWSLEPREIGHITSAAMVGMLCGSCVFGMLSDRIGRRLGFQLTILLFAFSTAACAFAQNPAQLMVMRFFVGFGIGGFIPIDTALLTEYLPTRWRGRLTALWGVAFPVGGLAATGLASLVVPAWGWRVAFAIGVLPAVLVLVIRRSVPETPRFLAARGRTAEAVESLRWIAGGRSTPRNVAAKPAPAPPAESTVRPTALLSAPHRRATAVVWVLWFCWSFAYFGITLWLPTLLVLHKVPLTKTFSYTIGFAVAAVVGRLVMLALVDRVGRRPLIVLTALAAAALTPLFGHQHGWARLVLAGYALSFFQDGGFSGIVPYTPELYPTALRSTGVGWANGLGRIAGMLAPLLVGELVAVHATDLAWVIFSMCFVCAAVAAWLGAETSGRGLDGLMERIPPRPGKP